MTRAWARAGTVVGVLTLATVNGMADKPKQSPSPDPWAGALDLRGAVVVRLGNTDVDHNKLMERGINPAGFKAPVRTSRFAPTYPDTAKRRGAEGLVAFECLVRDTGKVDACKLTRSVHHDLDREAFTATVKSGYEPATIGGRAIAILATFEMRFSLR